MIRTLTLAGSAAFIGAIVLLALDAESNAPTAIALILLSLVIGLVLGIRAGYHKARDVVKAAHSFATGNIQHARLVEVGEPKGIFSPSANMVLELEGEDGTVHRFDRDMPIPFPVAWSYRLGKRFNVPFLGRANLGEMLAFELRREGLDVSVSRAAGGEPPAGDEA